MGAVCRIRDVNLESDPADSTQGENAVHLCTSCAPITNLQVRARTHTSLHVHTGMSTEVKGNKKVLPPGSSLQTCCKRRFLHHVISLLHSTLSSTQTHKHTLALTTKMIGGWLLATTNYLAVTHGDSSVYLLYIPSSFQHLTAVCLYLYIHHLLTPPPGVVHGSFLITCHVFPCLSLSPSPYLSPPSLILLLQGVMFISDVSQFYIKTFSLTTKPKIFKKRTSEARINASDAPLNYNNAIS